MASNVEDISNFHNHYEPYTKTKPPKTKPKTPDKLHTDTRTVNGPILPTATQNIATPIPPSSESSPSPLSYTDYTPRSPTLTHSPKRGHDATPNGTRRVKQAHLHRSPTQIIPINLPTAPPWPGPRDARAHQRLSLVQPNAS